MNKNNTVRIPPLSSIETALRLYYSKTSLNKSDVQTLFSPKPSSATIARLKSLARDKMAEKDIPAWSGSNVETTAAFEAWHIDISDLERKLKKLNELKILTES